MHACSCCGLVFLLVLYCTSPSSEILDARARHAEQCNSDARARPKRRLSRARLLLSTPRSRSDSIHWLRETERIMHGHANAIAIVFGRCVRLHGHAASTFAGFVHRSSSIIVRTYVHARARIKLQILLIYICIFIWMHAMQKFSAASWPARRFFYIKKKSLWTGSQAVA